MGPNLDTLEHLISRPSIASVNCIIIPCQVGHVDLPSRPARSNEFWSNSPFLSILLSYTIVLEEITEIR